MIEIIGENLTPVFKFLCISPKNTYKCSIGHWPHFEVWELSDKEFDTLNKSFSGSDGDKRWEQATQNASWWRSAMGSNLGVPTETFVVKGNSILGWRDKYKLYDLEVEYNELPAEERSEYSDFDEYCNVWFPKHYDDILSYFCDELGASTERNVCALAVDLAKYNHISVSDIFRIYG